MASTNDTNNNNTSGEIPIAPKRHWNGIAGDRHEHQNVWLNGGIKGPAVTSPWAGWDAHRRRASDASTGSAGEATAGSPSSPKPSSLFTNLTQQKRNSTDVQANERRKSFADQLPKNGFISTMWHGWTKG